MLQCGTVLHTKDGRNIGNGIVLEVHYSLYFEPYYLVKTDFGNLLRLTDLEINELFYIGGVTMPIVQMLEQIRLLYTNFHEVFNRG